MMPHTKSKAVILVWIALMVSTLLAAGDARAQSEGQWSTPAKLFENSGTIREPNLVADPTGAVHAFWLHESDGTPMAIFYARKQGDAWTSPVDIISMSGTLSGPRATIDKSGRLKLIWHGPGNTLFFSTAESASATTATLEHSRLAGAGQSPFRYHSR